MDRPSEILPRVIDCGIEETDKGHKAWMVLDVTEGHAYTSLWMYSLRNRNRNPKVKDLLEPLSSFVSEVECIESYLNGGGIYDLWAGIILILQKDGRIHFHLDRINLAFNSLQNSRAISACKSLMRTAPRSEMANLPSR
jgi:hypothetical protein